MRVLHLGKFYPPAPGGIETFTAILAREQARAGDTVEVLAHSAAPSWRSRRRTDGAVGIVEAGRPGQLAYAPLSPAFPLQLQRCIDRVRPDLLHIHVPNTSAFAALLLPAARGVQHASRLVRSPILRVTTIEALQAEADSGA